MKLLVVTPEPVDADMLRSALGEEVEGAEVLVISPATNSSPVAFWVSDADEAIEEAEAAKEETVERLEEEGIDAAGTPARPSPRRRSATRSPPSTPTASSSSRTPRATATTARTRTSPRATRPSGSRSRTR